jgi:hypothetical protein
LTYGIIISESMTIAINEFGNPYWIRNAFEIEPDGEDPFSLPGDSGSLILKEEKDGSCVAIGILFIGGSPRKYAFPIKPALEAMNCQLLLTEE